MFAFLKRLFNFARPGQKLGRAVQQERIIEKVGKQKFIDIPVFEEIAGKQYLTGMDQMTKGGGFIGMP